MSTPERPDGDGPAEREARRYFRAARFVGERSAGHAYGKAQEEIYTAECNLSVFRLTLEALWHVAVTGEPPPAELDQRISAILGTGEPAALSPEVVRLLEVRGQQLRRQGPWSEGHYRPGKRL